MEVATPTRLAERPQRQEYTITVDKSSGQRLGMEYDDSDGVTLVIKGLKPGLIYDWICRSPSALWVFPEDAIIEVNGIAGDAELIEQECLKPQILNIKLRPAPIDPEAPAACVSDSNEVLVHVYDLWGARTRLSRPINAMTTRLGIFHTGVEVYGREWYFCGAESCFYGVYAMPEPKKHHLHRYRRTVCMGQTTLSRQTLEEIMPLLRVKWPAWSYNVVRRNCHHFTDFFCRALGFHAGPKCGIFGAGDPSLFLADSWISRGCFGCCRLRREDASIPSNPLLPREPALPNEQEHMRSFTDTESRQMVEEEILISDAMAAAIATQQLSEQSCARSPRLSLDTRNDSQNTILDVEGVKEASETRVTV